MNTVFSIMLGGTVFLILIMLQRVFSGPTLYDRTILLLVLFGYIDHRPDMYIDIAISYAILGFISSVVLAKYLGDVGGKKS